MNRTLSLGFSPCPNDTFLFEAMLHGRVDTEGLSFEVTIADVEELNAKALRRELDVTKLSFHALAYVVEDYALLDSGSALGKNCGPLLVAREAYGLGQLPDLRIAIPGQYTTANFLLSLAAPQAMKKAEILFSEIEERVLSGEFDAGLLIHENRFTYEKKGLKKIMDLGEYWETRTGCPIPLGGIAVHRRVPLETARKINRILRRSVDFAQAHPGEGREFVKGHAQAMEEEVIRNHISLYVNEYTRELGRAGREAIETLFRIAREEGLIPASGTNLFLPETIDKG